MAITFPLCLLYGKQKISGLFLINISITWPIHMRLHEGYKLASEKRRNRQYSGGTENVIFGGKINQIKSTFFSFHLHYNIEVNHHNKKYFNSVFDSLLYNIKSYIKCIIKRQLFFSSVSVSSPPQKYRFTYFRKFFFGVPNT